MKFIKKVFKLTVFSVIILATLGFALYGYNQIATKVEIKSANNISLYDLSGKMYFQGTGIN